MIRRHAARQFRYHEREGIERDGDCDDGGAEGLDPLECRVPFHGKLGHVFSISSLAGDYRGAWSIMLWHVGLTRLGSTRTGHMNDLQWTHQGSGSSCA